MKYNGLKFRFGNASLTYLIEKQLFTNKNFNNLFLVHDKKGCDTMGERIGRIGRIETDFFLIFSRIPSTCTHEKIRFNPPNPPNPFSHRITPFFVMY
jgi:hypothetical protein